MFTPFFCHCYLSGAAPAATTKKLAVCPAVTVWFAGGVVIVGATGAGFTVSVSALLVAVPAGFVTTTRNVDPLSAFVIAVVVYLLAVAPAIFAQFSSPCH